MHALILFLIALVCPIPVCAEDGLMRDLMIVDYWNRRIYDRMPVYFNNLLLGGYFNMPSARMGEDGELGAGYAWVDPYIHYNLRIQLIKYLEISGNYRIFKGVDDPILTPLGFGDLSDKGANVKFSPFTPEDSGYKLPGIAFGFEDFLGTRNFKARYVALTKVFLDYNAEITLGYGQQRIKGFFGGIHWLPFRQTCCAYLKNFCLCAEYDAIPYHDSQVELHPKGRRKKTPINFGIKWRLFDQFDLSLSYIRGHKLAFSASTFYNFGNTEGFIPKIDDPLPYNAPVNNQPIGFLRPIDVLVQDLILPFSEQGFDILQIWISYNECYQKVLRLRLLNNIYRSECIVRDRLNHLLMALIPEDIGEVVAVIEAEGFPVHEYLFRMPYVRDFAEGGMGAFELNLLNPMREVTYPDPFTSSQLFRTYRDLWNLEIFPKTNAFFGSSKGKFKYALGVHLGINGFIFDDIYYSTLLGYTFISNMRGLTGIDRLNPSQIVNVRTDIVQYYKRKGVTLDEAYVQKYWNVGRGWFGRLAAGLFEEEYGGVAAEVLFFPVNSCWAIGADGAYLRKRTYQGLGFTNRFRKLKGFQPHFVHFEPRQYFLNLYYNWVEAQVNFKVKIGKFLANDYGARFELMRFFPSGLQVSVWYTYTNAHDRINGKVYYDKGVAFSMPLDIFYTHSERDRWGYGMSAWLRDAGVTAYTGQALYELISELRE